MTITGSQIREARKLLGWSQSRIAGETGVSRAAIAYFEGRRRRLPSAHVVSTLRGIFAASGIEFSEDGGVRMKSLAVVNPTSE